MANAIEIKGLTKHYKGFCLDHVDITVPEGCIMGFVGANGAGKTTTIKNMLGLVHPDEGQIRVFGKDYAKEGPKIRKDIGVVFDECCFPPGLTATEVSGFMKHVCGRWDEGRYKRLLGRFAIPTDKKIKDFSRGMKMKLSMAAALTTSPRLLILDEATSGVDPVVRDEILDLLLEFIQREDHTVFISSHITSDLEKAADYVSFINNGRIVLSGEKDMIMETYGVAHCDEDLMKKIPEKYVAGVRRNHFGTDALIRSRAAFSRQFPEIPVDRASIEEILLFEVRGEKI